MDIRKIFGVKPFQRFPDTLPTGIFTVLAVVTEQASHTIVFSREDELLHFILIPSAWIRPIPDPLTEIEIVSTFGGIQIKLLAYSRIQQPCFLFVSQAKARIFDLPAPKEEEATFTALLMNRPQDIAAAFEKDGKRFLILETPSGDYLLREDNTTAYGNGAAWESAVTDPRGFVFELRDTAGVTEELLYRKPVGRPMSE